METKQDILEVLNLEADKHNELEHLQQNISTTSWWRAIKDVVAFTCFLIIEMFNQLKKDIDQKISNTEIGLEPWHKEICYAYQHGDKLVSINNRPAYLNVNESKRVVKRASIRKLVGGGVKVKVLGGSDDNLQAFSGEVLSGFAEYYNKNMPFGTLTEFESQDADSLFLNITVELDASFFDSSGKSLISGKFEVKEAIENYCKHFDFDGTFYLSKLVDQLQKIDGVKDAYVNSSKLNNTDFVRKIDEVPAGWLVLTDDSVINYVFD